MERRWASQGRAALPRIRGPRTTDGFAVYGDRHSSLRRNDKHWTLEDELAGRQEPTQVGVTVPHSSYGVTFSLRSDIFYFTLDTFLLSARLRLSDARVDRARLRMGGLHES
jgi:hypothetical protein